VAVADVVGFPLLRSARQRSGLAAYFFRGAMANFQDKLERVTDAWLRDAKRTLIMIELLLSCIKYYLLLDASCEKATNNNECYH
jgi:hypothetical protein